MQEEETHNSCDIKKGGWKCTNKRPPEVVDFLRCNTADIDWYMRMPIYPPMLDPKAEMQSELCEKAATTL